MKTKKRKQRGGGGRDGGVLLIAIFKLFKAALLVALAVGALSMLHESVADAAKRLLAFLHVDHNNRFLHGMIVKLSGVDDHKLEALSAGSFFYAALLGTEGTGLLLRKRWANYLTIVATALFIPLEVYELFKHFGVGKIVVLLINLAVVFYLIYRLRHEPK